MNNKLKSTIAALCSLAILTACSSKQTENQTTEHIHQSDPEQQTTQTENIAQTKDAILNAILPYYDALQQALVEEDITKAKEAALLVEEGGRKLSEGKKLEEMATAILKASTLAEQRKAFAELSKYYIASVKQVGVASGEFYVAHCPMAFDQQGADWLTISKSLKNPYFGNNMLTCGTIEETLQ